MNKVKSEYKIVMLFGRISCACVHSFHYILIEIDVENGVVTVLDSRRKDRNEYAEITELLAK